MEWLGDVDWLMIIPWVVTGANVITAATPTKTDDAIWNGISRALNIFALNVGRNRNADDV